MCCSVRVPAIVTCAACRRSQTVPDWQAAGAWERARPEPGAALWRRLLDAVREPAACCSDACAARGGAGAVSRPARVSLAAAGQPADRATEQPAGPESGRRAAPRPPWLPLVAGMGLGLAACVPPPAARGP